MTRLRDFYNMLESYDWHYSYSDDPRAYRKGKERGMALRVIAAESSAHQALYDAYREFMLTDNAPFPTIAEFEVTTHD